MFSRRHFVLFGVKSVIFLPVIVTAACKSKPEIDKHLLSEDNETAKVFKYTKDGTTVPMKLNRDIPNEEQLCNTCEFYKPIGDDYGECTTLKGNVTSKGYCTAWAKKTTT